MVETCSSKEVGEMVKEVVVTCSSMEEEEEEMARGAVVTCSSKVEVVNE